MTRQLRRGFAEKLEERKIPKVWRYVDGKLTLVWEQIDGVWTPMNDDTYYDEKELPYFITHLARDDNRDLTLCSGRPFKPSAPEGLRVVYQFCEDCQLIARNYKETN